MPLRFYTGIPSGFLPEFTIKKHPDMSNQKITQSLLANESHDSHIVYNVVMRVKMY